MRTGNNFERKKWELVAINPKSQSSNSVSLAQWEPDSSGYECSIKLNGRKYICEDKEALEKCLADLLAEPLIAKTLMHVMNA